VAGSQDADNASPTSALGRTVAGWAELGLDAAAFLLLPVLALASRGVAALASVAGVLALALAWRAGGAAWRGLATTAALLAGFVLWGAASAAWSIEPGRSLVMAARLAGLFAAGLALLASVDAIAAPARLLRCLVAGMMLGILLLVVQRATGGVLARPFFVRPFIAPTLNQASDTLGILALPVAAALAHRGRTGLALLFLAAAAATVFGLVGDAAKASFASGSVVALLCWRWRRPLARLAAAAAVALVVTAPLTFAHLADSARAMQAAEEVKSSVSHRLLIWSFVGHRIAERPFFGWGLDTSRAIPGGGEPIRPGQQWLPLHPHNAPLQLWLELGVPGAVLAALVVARLWLRLAAIDWPRRYAAAGAGGLAAAAIDTLGTYGAWQEWWIGTLWLALFLVCVVARSLEGRSGPAHGPVLPSPDSPAPPWKSSETPFMQ
jgi:O-Antigen ligase